MSLGNDHRIRQVAIVLQSLDASTARTLLSQFPADTAKSIRRALTRLGAVSVEERETAFRELDQLHKSTLNSPIEPERVGLARSTETRELETATPTLEFSLDHPQSTRTTHQAPQTHQARPVDRVFAAPPWLAQPAPPPPVRAWRAANPPGTPNDLAHPHSACQDSAWNDLGATSLATSLQHERPLVIAAVLNQLPLPLAAETLQQMPHPVATQALALLPTLHRADPDAVFAIQQEIKTNILRGGQQPPPCTGRERLQAILAALPSEVQPMWSAYLNNTLPKDDDDLPADVNHHAPQSNPSATSLKSDTHPSSESSLHSHRTRSHQASPQDGSLEIELTPPNTPSAAFTVIFPTLPSSGVDHASTPFQPPNAPSALAPDAHPTLTTAHVTNDPLPADVLPMTDTHPQRSMDEILNFSDADLVRILHSSNPQTVLLSMCHASPQVRLHVERLLPEKDIQRFRSRVMSLEAAIPIHAADAVSARRIILDCADSLLANGVVHLRSQSRNRRSA